MVPSSASNRIIGAKDHASIQMNIAEVIDFFFFLNFVYNGFSVFLSFFFFIFEYIPEVHCESGEHHPEFEPDSGKM